MTAAPSIPLAFLYCSIQNERKYDISWFMLFDKGTFKSKGFAFGIGNNIFKIPDFADHCECLWCMRHRTLKILTYPIF